MPDAEQASGNFYFQKNLLSAQKVIYIFLYCGILIPQRSNILKKQKKPLDFTRGREDPPKADIKMNKNLKQLGDDLKRLRIGMGMSLRDVCKIVNYDASNWSKIERGVLSPPDDIKTLTNWAKALGLKTKQELQGFLDDAMIAQGIIPQDILSQINSVNLLPAFFRTVRGGKPSKAEIDKLIELIRRSR